MAIASSDKLVVVKAFAPSNPLPLDAREIHESLAEARVYAATSAIAYAGQDIKVVENGAVTVYTLVPSDVEGENFKLQFVGGGGSGIQDVAASTKAGHIAVTVAEGDASVTKDVLVKDAFVDVEVKAGVTGEDGKEKSDTLEFTLAGDQKKSVYATGVRKVESNNGKIKVTSADATGDLSVIEFAVGSATAPTYESETRKITIPYIGEDGNETSLVIELGKDMVVTSGEYVADEDEDGNPVRELVLTLTNGETVHIPVADLIDIYTGNTSNTVAVTVSSDNKISAAVKLSVQKETEDGPDKNILKSDANGLYVVESDFVETKQLITTAQANAKTEAQGLVDTAVAAINASIEADKATLAEDLNTIRGLITAEETARTQADTGIGTRIDGIESAYKAADEALDGRVTALETADTNFNTALEGLETELKAADEAMAKDITDLKAADTELDGKITALDTAYKAADTAIATEIADLKAADTELDGRITALDTAYKAADEAINTAITNLQTADTNMTTRVDGIETAYKAKDEELAGKITALETADTNMGTRVDGIETAYKAKDEELAGKITALESADTQATARMDELAAADEELDGRIDTVEADYKAADVAINTAITNLQTADTNMGTRVDGIETAYKAADTAMTTRVDGVETAYKAADEATLASATTYADTQDTATYNAAVAYTDQVVAQLGVKWVDFGATVEA